MTCKPSSHQPMKKTAPSLAKIRRQLKATRFVTMGFTNQVFIRNWHWWDKGNAALVHKWLDDYAEGGCAYCVDEDPGKVIKFKHECELTAFLLRWNE